MDLPLEDGFFFFFVSSLDILCSKSNWRHLHVSIDIQPIIFRGQYYWAVIHEADVKTLGMFNFRFQSGQELSLLREHGQVEVVMVVGDDHLSGGIDADANGIIGDA